MNLLEETISVLHLASYETYVDSSHREVVNFENEIVFGWGFIYPNSADVLEKWEQRQDLFLREKASLIRASAGKIWNIYTLHFTAENPSSRDTARLLQIEEDFRGTRKIARAGLNSPEKLRQALLPLLPLQSRVALHQATLIDRLNLKLQVPEQTKHALFSGADSVEIARTLVEGS